MSKKLLFNGRVYDGRPGETVLGALLRQQVDVPYACQKMSCMSCMMRSLNGTPPIKSQKNLKETLQLQNNFLACGCIPDHDMEVALPNETLTRQVIELNPLNPIVLELVLQYDSPIDYHGGQSVLLLNYEYIGKNFSIASPGSYRTNGRLEIHIERIPGGAFSEWMHRKLKIGDRLLVCGVSGELFYSAGDPQQTLLLAAWNGSLGALIGLMQDAFEQHHSGPVWLFHGVPTFKELYYIDELNEIAEYFPNFNYISKMAVFQGFRQRTVYQNMSEMVTDMSGWKVFLCDNRKQVHQIQRYAYLAGAGMKDIYLEVTSL